MLYRHALKLATYDFESQVDVNILGHIFENSLNEIESINAEIEGSEFDKQKSKRKKDGVFYTPKYITKYIVENTVGKLCDEKKVALGFKEEEYFKGRAKRPKTKIMELVKLLDDYRAWLLELTICDPASGSGAFLNQALDFLIKEHKYIDELKAKILGGGLIFSDIENTILENNIYGVDLNEESVEIAKLSLWLRTAQPRRKLNDLSSNVKCGNSLIADKKGAGNKTFIWEEEFPKVFERGGFDVVIGNPPYVKLETIKEQSQQLEKYNFETFDKRGDLYVLFVEKGFNILKPKGVLSYIMPNKWLQAGYGQPLRSYFLTKALHQLIDFGDIQIFQGATTYPIIFVASNNSPEKEFKVAVLQSAKATDFETNVSLSFEWYKTSSFDENTWVISSKSDKNLLTRLEDKFVSLDEFTEGKSLRGVLTGLTNAFIIDQNTRDSIVAEDANSVKLIHPVLRGRDIKPFHGKLSGVYMICTFPSLNIDIDKYPGIKNHFLNFGKSKLEQSGQKGSRKKTSNKWFETQDAIGYWKDFQKPKIMYQVFQVKPCFIYDDLGLYCNDSMWIIPTENRTLAGVLNSKMGWWLTTKYCTQIQNGCQLIWKYFGQVPIPKLNNELDTLVADMIRLTKSLDTQLNGLLNLVKSKFTIEKFSNKLQNWNELDFANFNKELKKQKVQLSLAEEAEWLFYFEEEKKKALELQRQINQTNQEIDQMVYELYGLTEEEIEIVKNI